jgi:hypothetical protein
VASLSSVSARVSLPLSCDVLWGVLLGNGRIVI